jgi:hypothetical protein
MIPKWGRRLSETTGGAEGEEAREAQEGQEGQEALGRAAVRWLVSCLRKLIK